MTRLSRRRSNLMTSVALLASAICGSVSAASPSPPPSVCRGTPAAGSLENGCKLPPSGENFDTYSRLAGLLGRTWVHCEVAAAVTDAYAVLASERPELRFVYGETGFAGGGRFRPHKTHQNGLSVDFFVPVRRGGEPARLPAHFGNRYGYDLELDGEGRLGELRLDADAMIEHLLALDRAARRNGIAIDRVLFDPDLQPILRRTAAWPRLRDRVRLASRRSWVRHDEHYHVDFEVPCEPLR